jgi:predicted Abi (CAAX) family protease
VIDDAISRLELRLGRLLHAGILTSAACLTAGLALWMSGAWPVIAGGLLAAGLLILMATPMLRVVVSLVAYARMRDWFFVGTTLMVLVVLVVTVALSLLER